MLRSSGAKTTLVDCLLKQSGTNLGDQQGVTRVMDSNALEKERGITILSKCTSIKYKDHRINIVDTPGHADFGGEVERVLSMVDGVALVVDATEGPMTQTRFVLSKALKHGLRPVVVINKADRPTSRIPEVETDLMDLFFNLEATEEQLEYQTVYASAKEGWATGDMDNIHKPELRKDMSPLFDMILHNVPHPKVDRAESFSLLVTQLDHDDYVGKLYLGKIQSGILRVNDEIQALNPDGTVTDSGRCVKLFVQDGLKRVPVEAAGAGDIVLIAGLKNATVNTTMCSLQITEPIPSTPIDPPTVAMNFSVNDSPLGGQEGTRLTSNLIRERLLKEAETNVALRVGPSAENPEIFEVSGRGELQLGVLVETMRREGFEMSISAPRVLLKPDPDDPKQMYEPIEEAIIDVDPKFAGTIIEKMSQRKAELKLYTDIGDKTRLVFRVPARGLMGFASEFRNDTHGEGVLTHSFLEYEPYKGPMGKIRKGALVSVGDGEATNDAIERLQSRGIFFISPGDIVYSGMVVGENAKEGDMPVNPVKAKVVSNVRSSGKEETIKLVPPRLMTLEECMSYVADDEVIEVTPTRVRLRKRPQDKGKRK
ncbi:P-loop containing nucleoside triphosphate hydrolase protein [Polychytrium aggregatum]|uniref:P-loop containing nucleoside triphosphate hydrolase protein n=1 Tax=Polychytrium aggregatum TaxID=110093 RepID=UPI0022FF2BD3|nr:P-loop containing nucleoside triphosphate hydrolase protein [Polychytrium aggregatum]KAI9206144.1 P-loop containing nucleoside triphosphate hydrolase protein [Polychytrium aggregatum]